MNVTPTSMLPKMRRQKQKRRPPMTAMLRGALEKTMGVVGFAINQLMTRSKINWNWELEPEELFSIQLADRLRALTTQYYETGGTVGLRAIWFAVPNEGTRSAITAIIMRAKGMIKGALDFVFVWEGGGGIMELKAGDNGLTPEQEYFITWARAFGINHAVHRNVQSGVDDAIETLIKWGAVVGIPPRCAGDVTEGGTNDGTKERSV